MDELILVVVIRRGGAIQIEMDTPQKPRVVRFAAEWTDAPSGDRLMIERFFAPPKFGGSRAVFF